MSTNDVPGYNSANRDELRAGCWAEHQDGSLIYVYAVEADMVSYRIFDMTKSPPIEYLDRMSVKEFGELFSCNPSDINKVIAVPRGKDKKRVTKQVYTWHDKTPSDLLVKFIEYLNSLRLNQKEALGLPIDLFIAWLIIEAAKADDEEPQEAELAKLEGLMRQHVRIDPPAPLLALPAPMPRCFCGRFMARQRAAKGLMFCGGSHMDRYEARLAA